MTAEAPRPNLTNDRPGGRHPGWVYHELGCVETHDETCATGLRNYADQLVAANEALKAEQSRFLEEITRVQIERDALNRRLAAAEAGIAAEIQVAERDYVREWPSDLGARGRMRGRREGLEIAARIVAGAE